MDMKQRVSQLISTMPLAEKVGQLFMLAFAGPDLEYAKKLIKDWHIGGFYLTDDNSRNSAEALRLNQQLQHEAALRHCDAPLILGVDQEGAWGILTKETDLGPGNLALGKADDTSLTAQMYQVLASQMQQLGYNTLLAPCADVNTNPDNPIIGQRSFGEQPQGVSRHVKVAVQSVLETGMLCSVKHFPGHGDTATDSHSGLPSVDRGLAELLQTDLQPFVAAIEAGVPLIMTSHIFYPKLDAVYPATLSSTLLTGLLRKQLGFDGVILTDSMNMGAMRRHYGPVEAAVLALKAGADLIMLSEEHYENANTPYKELQQQTIQGVIDVVVLGELAESRIDEALRRVLCLRYQWQSCAVATTAVLATQAGDIAEEAARKAIKVLRNAAGLWPLGRNRFQLAFVTHPQYYDRICNSRGIGPNDPIPASHYLTERLQHNKAAVLLHSFSQLEQMLQQGDSLPAHGPLVLVTEDYPLPGEQMDLAEQQQRVQRALKLWGDQVIVLALRSDYELAEYPDLTTYICSYSSRKVSAFVAADLLVSSNNL
jgi:beta-N-acetylhexosaminidase